MAKRLMLLGVVCLMLMSFITYAEVLNPDAQQQKEQKDSSFVPNEDLIRNDSAKLSDSVDPKMLFAASYEEAGLSKTKISAPALNPKAESFVKSYTAENSNFLNNLSDWGKPYLDLMGDILESYGIPAELKYLAVVESQLKRNSRSAVGAVGPWQFMPATARDLGLRVNSSVDERKDFRKSTRAAALYLRDLYRTYDDWLLVIAAYNCGPGVVNHAIRRVGSRNFWTIQYSLPAESRNHVKKYIATHCIMEGTPGLTTLTKAETKSYLENFTLELESSNAALQPAVNVTPAISTNLHFTLTGRYNAAVIAKYLAMNILDFNQMNPDFDRLMADKGSYELNLPADKMEMFKSQRQQILRESVRLLLESVQQRTETTSSETTVAVNQ